MKNSKSSLSKNYFSSIGQTSRWMETRPSTSVWEEESSLNHLRIFESYISHLQEEVNRLDFMITEIHDVLKSRFQ